MVSFTKIVLKDKAKNYGKMALNILENTKMAVKMAKAICYGQKATLTKATSKKIKFKDSANFFGPTA